MYSQQLSWWFELSPHCQWLIVRPSKIQINVLLNLKPEFFNLCCACWTFSDGWHFHHAAPTHCVSIICRTEAGLIFLTHALCSWVHVSRITLNPSFTHFPSWTHPWLFAFLFCSITAIYPACVVTEIMSICNFKFKWPFSEVLSAGLVVNRKYNLLDVVTQWTHLRAEFQMVVLPGCAAVQKDFSSVLRYNCFSPFNHKMHRCIFHGIILSLCFLWKGFWEIHAVFPVWIPEWFKKVVLIVGHNMAPRVLCRLCVWWVLRKGDLNVNLHFIAWARQTSKQ